MSKISQSRHGPKTNQDESDPPKFNLDNMEQWWRLDVDGDDFITKSDIQQISIGIMENMGMPVTESSALFNIYDADDVINYRDMDCTLWFYSLVQTWDFKSRSGSFGVAQPSDRELFRDFDSDPDAPQLREGLILCVPCGDADFNAFVNLPVPGAPVLARSSEAREDCTGSEDFEIWCSNVFTSNRGWMGGDFNLDGVTDVTDFNMLNAMEHESSAEANPRIRIPDSVRTAVAREAARASAPSTNFN